MTKRSVGRIVAGATLMVLAFLTAPAGVPVAAADGCPDAEVVFARGTGEPVGPGGPGQAFFDSLTSQLPGKTVNLYPVDYPSTTDYANSAKVGAADEVAHVQTTVASCPKTKVVIGGYSQGAGVADLTSHQLSPQGAKHVAAVALFGKPAEQLRKGSGGQPDSGDRPELQPEDHRYLPSQRQHLRRGRQHHRTPG